MNNRKLSKALAVVLSTAGLAAQSNITTATAFKKESLPVGDPAGFATTNTLPPYTWDGGNIGFGHEGTPASNKKYPYYPAGQARIGGTGPMDKSTVDTAKNLGWNHTIAWYAFQITTAGGYTISIDRTTADTNFQPAFSVWTSGVEKWDVGSASSHSFDQVNGPEGFNGDGNAGGHYMTLPTGKSITGFIGYANSGPGYINGVGSTVLGALSFGTSTLGPLKDLTQPYDSIANQYTSIVVKGTFVDPHAGKIEPAYAGVGSSVNTSNPSLTNAAGGGHADLQLWLTPGWYAMPVGGSCADFTCTPTGDVKGGLNIKILPNSAVTAPIPIADAGTDQTGLLELSKVTLHGSGADPKGSDIASYQWRQVDGPTVTLSNAASPNPSFIAPIVGKSGGPVALAFELVVTDSSSDCNGKGCSSLPTPTKVTISDDPSILDCSMATASKTSLFPANKKMVTITIGGITGTKPYSLSITSVTSDEPVKDKAAKDTTAPDAIIKKGKATKAKPQAVDGVQLRAERQAKGNGRAYAVNFQANDDSQTCSGRVKVEAPLSAGSAVVDDGQVNDATKKK